VNANITKLLVAQFCADLLPDWARGFFQPTWMWDIWGPFVRKTLAGQRNGDADEDANIDNSMIRPGFWRARILKYLG
jgi:hypothetical protein